MNKDSSKNKAIIYGLKAEGYRIASSLAIRGMKVSLVDEAARMAITLKPEIAALTQMFHLLQTTSHSRTRTHRYRH